MLLAASAGNAAVGHWSFDGAGTTVPDESGVGNNGTIVGLAVRVPGMSGDALDLSGSGSRVLVADDPTLDVAAGFSVAAWLRPTEFATQYLVKKARHKETDGYELSLSRSGKLFVRFNQPSAGNAYRVDSVSSYPVDGVTWMHVAATYDGQAIRIYVDGVLEASANAPGLVIATNDLALSIGAEDDGYRGFDGALDEVHLYDMALTEAEIQTLSTVDAPTGTDTDGDGVSNEQDAFPNDPSEWVDTDGDGVGNNADADDDGDGMHDQWEILNGFDPLDASDALEDADGDGLSNLEEFLQGSDPNTDADTDGDGVSNEQDAFPNDPSEWVDTDGDGVGNNADADDDGDGIHDQWEILNGFDPLDASDASEDVDGDGLSNLEEFLQGSDPNSAPTLFELGHWSFDGATGAAVPDESGAGNDGTLVGSAVWAPGVNGDALELSGDGSRVLVPDDGTLDVAAGFTVAAWLRPTRFATQYLVKKARHKEVDGYELSLSRKGKLFVRFNQPSARNAYRVDSVSSYPVDGVTWMHVAATYDGQAIRMYVDGALEASSNAPDLVIAANDLALSIGAEDDGYRGFDGALDEVHLYDVALAEAEVQALATVGSPTDTDTDGDGVPNGQDAFPNDPSEWVDADGDGIGNNADADDDGDHMHDQWESFFGLNSLDPVDAGSDGDMDGVSNLDEWLAGTNPRDDLGLPDLDSWNRYSIGVTPSGATTGEKPQSKLWFHQGDWWAAFPDDNATWLWRLDGDTWTRVLLLSVNRYVRADYEFDAWGDLVHLLLFDANASTLVSVEYVYGSANGYQLWSARPQAVTVPLTWAAETATLALDSSGRLWVAYDDTSTIEVRYSDAGDDYTTWSAPIVLASGLLSDEIGAIVAFDGKIGVIWSNQIKQRFGFRVHLDADPPEVWSADEVPASQSAQDVGDGMADDHINLAVASDGTLYAAVKTGFDSAGFPKIALLVRRPSGSWDDLHEVDTLGTRPIVVLNEELGSLMVVYTDVTGGGDIVFRSSDADVISFGPKQSLIEGMDLDNVSSTKQPFSTELVVIASTSGTDIIVAGASLSPF